MYNVEGECESFLTKISKYDKNEILKIKKEKKDARRRTDRPVICDNRKLLKVVHSRAESLG